MEQPWLDRTNKDLRKAKLNAKQRRRSARRQVKELLRRAAIACKTSGKK